VVGPKPRAQDAEGGLDLVEIRSTRHTAWGADAEEDELAEVECLAGIVGELEPFPPHTVANEALERWFHDRNVAVLELHEPRPLHLHADDAVTDVREARGDDTSDVTVADDGDRAHHYLDVAGGTSRDHVS
jgi:hypothetical protein